jgi:hypothetical protein
MAPNQNSTEPPLWSIGIAAAIILTAPLVLYSLAPTGPLREGDTVFSDGEQHVGISGLNHNATGRTDDTCLLDPDSPLIIVHVSQIEADDSFIAQVQGNPSDEWPFCPVLIEVAVKPHQVFQKPGVFRAVQGLLIRLFSS